ncbi:MAG: GTP-binding protein [Acidobacteria bacterium]|nr:GTP-binding protein [Acidobacteriota bacterium]
MKIDAEFVTSATAAGGYPKDGLPELALAGRSNVGKSSLINALVGRTIARTSAEPGKTRLANIYRVAPVSGPAFYLIDLPGYGYARAGRAPAGTQRSAQAGRAAALEEFAAITAAYFERLTNQVGFETSRSQRSNRVGFDTSGSQPGSLAALLLVDSRHPGLPSDAQAWAWLGQRAVPRFVVATKVDKLTRAERTRHLNELARIFAGPVTAVSAATGEGLEALWTLIARLLRQPPPTPAPSPATPSR